VQLDVTVRNEVSADSGYYAIAVLVTSPQLDKHVTMWCGLMGPGTEKVVDDSSGDYVGYDGEFPVTEESMEFTILACGFQPPVTCRPSNFPGAATSSVTQTATLAAQGETVEPPQLVPYSVGVTPEQTTVGSTVTVQAQANSQGGTGQAQLKFGVGTPTDQFTSFVTREFQVEPNTAYVKTADFDIPPAGAEYDHVAATTNHSTEVVTAPLTVNAPALENAITVMSAGFAQAGTTVTEGDELAYDVRLENTSSLNWRIECTFTDGATGEELGVEIADALAPGAETVLSTLITARAPQREVCYSLTGQPV
jgi:hypothetical protein